MAKRDWINKDNRFKQKSKKLAQEKEDLDKQLNDQELGNTSEVKGIYEKLSNAMDEYEKLKTESDQKIEEISAQKEEYEKQVEEMNKLKQQ